MSLAQVYPELRRSSRPGLLERRENPSGSDSRLRTGTGAIAEPRASGQPVPRLNDADIGARHASPRRLRFPEHAFSAFCGSCRLRKKRKANLSAHDQ